MSVTAAQMLHTLRLRSAEAKRQSDADAARARATVVSLVKDALPPRGRAWLVGSLAWGGFGERSDVDLVFDDVADEVQTAIELAITRATKLTVDLLSLRTLSPEFQARVEREGIPLHGR
jgi:hypothetical protein